MSIRKIKLIEGEYYHIYNRGNSKQKIFHDKQDYQRFLFLLFASNTNTRMNFHNLKRDTDFDIYKFERSDLLVSIGAYCLMPNHFHLIITEKSKNGISKFMQKLTTAYSMYYNKKYDRSGGLFEGKFKSEHLDSDRYLKYLFSYVHLNPIKLIQKDWKEKGIKDKKEAMNFLNKYEYSSFLDFIGGNRLQNIILNKNDFPKYFPNEELFRKEILEWMNYGNK